MAVSLLGTGGTGAALNTETMTLDDQACSCAAALCPFPLMETAFLHDSQEQFIISVNI